MRTDTLIMLVIMVITLMTLGALLAVIYAEDSNYAERDIQKKILLPAESPKPVVFTLVMNKPAEAPVYYKPPIAYQKDYYENYYDDYYAPRKHYIEIDDDLVHPSEVYVRRGEKVIWENTDSVSHRLTFYYDDDSYSYTLHPGESYYHTFNHRGDFDYRVAGDHDMHGTVVVY